MIIAGHALVQNALIGGRVDSPRTHAARSLRGDPQLRTKVGRPLADAINRVLAKVG
jgi:hypothetical protein